MPATVSHIPPFEQFQTLASVPPPAGESWAIPVYRTLLADHLTPVTAYERLSWRSEYAFLLESVVGGERIARYSFLGAGPRRVIKAHGNRVAVVHPQEAGKGREYASADPLRELEALLKPVRGVRLPAGSAGGAGGGGGRHALPSLVGGAVGFAGYDTVRYLEPEKLPNVPRDDRGLPDMLFGIYDEVVIFDHV